MRNEPVYRRRRLVALILVLAVIFGVIWAVSAVVRSARSGDDSSAAAPQSTAAESSPSSASASESADATATPVDCAADALTLAVAAKGSTFKIGSAINLAVSITSDAEQPCLVDGSDTSRVVTITSGKERIWSSADCADKEERSLLLSKGSKDSQTVTWNTERSEPGCAGDQPTLQPGTYKAQVTLGEAKSEQLVLVLE